LIEFAPPRQLNRYATEGMKHLYDEVLRRFPEVASYVSEGDDKLPHVVVSYIADWLLSVELDPATIQRVVDFDGWCIDQPRGKTAADDIVTIEVVALRERLFAHDKLLPIVPKLMTRQELLLAREYLTSWVGADRYQAALRLTDGVA
jgi:hypothetical protein